MQSEKENFPGIHRYIFQGEINHLFAERIHEFHEYFIETMLLCGVDKIGARLDEIKMTKNPKYNLKYYKKIVGGILKFPPELFVCAIDENNDLLAELMYFHLNDSKTIDDIFLLQNVYNWNGAASHYCSQVWLLNKTNMCNIEQYWND